MNKIKAHLIIISIIYILFSVFLFGKSGNMLIDFSREVYIPFQMLNGEVLTKDIFQIYGFWGYFINQLLYKINPSPIILLAEAHILAYLIVVGFYLTIINFTKKNYALIFTLFFISINIFSNSIFSFVVPYSYSMIWAVLASIYLMYFTLKKNYSLSFLFLGLILVNRIELFILFLIGYSIYLIHKKINFTKNIPYIFIFPLMNVLYIYLNKITFKDIINNLNLLKTMSEAPSIHYLYKITGVFFSKYFFIKNIEELMIFLLIVIIGYFLYIKKLKISSIGFLFFALFFFNQNGMLFCLGAILLIFLTIINIKKLTDKEILLIGFSLILSSKALFNTSYLGYGNFGYIFILFSCYLICTKFMSEKYLISFIIVLLTTLNIFNIIYYKNNPKLQTNTKGIYLTRDFKGIFDKTNNFIAQNIPKNQNFIVIPEGQIFNLIHQKSWGFYNSTFTPLDFDTFKDENFIQRLKTNKTPYIIFFPRNTLDYGKSPICYNFGVDFCTYVMDNYTRIAIIEDYYKVLIFKRNEK